MVAVILVITTMTMEFLVILRLISCGFIESATNGVCLMVYKLFKVTSTKKAVDMEMIGSNVALDVTKSYTNMQLIRSFSGDITITRIGILGKIYYKYNPFLKVK